MAGRRSWGNPAAICAAGVDENSGLAEKWYRVCTDIDKDSATFRYSTCDVREAAAIL